MSVLHTLETLIARETSRVLIEPAQQLCGSVRQAVEHLLCFFTQKF